MSPCCLPLQVEKTRANVPKVRASNNKLQHTHLASCVSPASVTATATPPHSPNPFGPNRRLVSPAHHVAAAPAAAPAAGGCAGSGGGVGQVFGAGQSPKGMMTRMTSAADKQHLGTNSSRGGGAAKYIHRSENSPPPPQPFLAPLPPPPKVQGYAAHLERLAKAIPQAQDMEMGSRDPFQPRSPASNDLGAGFYPASHLGCHRSSFRLVAYVARLIKALTARVDATTTGLMMMFITIWLEFGLMMMFITIL